MRNTVTIDGVSSADVGLYFDKLPYIPAAKRRSNTYQIPGAGEDLTIHSDDYDDISMTLTAYMRPGTDHQAAYNWAHGEKIVLSTQPTVYGIIKAVGEIAPTRVGWAAHQFDIPLTLSPFRYLLAGDEEIILSANPAYISNAGNIHSLPLYKMTGCSGDVSITVNGVQFTITDAPSDVYIDMASETVYTFVDGNKESILESTEGAFWNMSLNPGVNEISWSGTVGSVSVNIRTRWV